MNETARRRQRVLTIVNDALIANTKRGLAVNSSRLRQSNFERAFLAAAVAILIFVLCQIDFHGRSLISSSTHASVAPLTSVPNNASADLAISMTSPTTGPVLLGQLITYDVSVANNGPDTASQ